jgi:hypothetical protein
MIKALVFLFVFALTHNTNALQCNKYCGMGNCAGLSYFLMNCAHCEKPREKCAQAFCQNNPTLCKGNVPLEDLSINTGEVSEDGKAKDVCIARLFPEMTFKEHPTDVGRSNGDLTITGLNTLDITTFAQTGGATSAIKYERNLGILKNLMANYYVYKTPILRGDNASLNRIIEQEFVVTYGKNIKQLTLLDFHTIAQDLRSKIYTLKGIDTQLRLELYEEKKYPLTVSKFGCAGEKSAAPIQAPM